MPLQSILGEDGELQYDRVLENVADTLGTEEFVLTYFMPRPAILMEKPALRNDECDVTEGNETFSDSSSITTAASLKYFVSCPEDFLDALRQFPNGELVLVPQVPQQTILHNAEEEEDGMKETWVESLKVEPTIGEEEVELVANAEKPVAYLRLYFQGRGMWV